MSRVGFSPGIRSHIRRFLISGPKYCPVSPGDRLNAVAMSLEEAVFMAAFGRFLPFMEDSSQPEAAMQCTGRSPRVLWRKKRCQCDFILT
jgi:hypothetical protein